MPLKYGNQHSSQIALNLLDKVIRNVLGQNLNLLTELLNSLIVQLVMGMRSASFFGREGRQPGMQVTAQEVLPPPKAIHKDKTTHSAAGMGAGMQPSAGSWALWQGCRVSEVVSHYHQAGAFVSLVIGLKLAGVSFEKETCYRACSWARPELVSGFFLCANLGGQLGSWGGSDKFSSALVSAEESQQHAHPCTTRSCLLRMDRFEFS